MELAKVKYWFISADFFQLLFVCLQCRVFYIENTHQMELHGGGDNKDITEDVEAKVDNPTDDFLSCKEWVINPVLLYIMESTDIYDFLNKRKWDLSYLYY